jgi:hypothetical protein
MRVRVRRGLLLVAKEALVGSRAEAEWARVSRVVKVLDTMLVRWETWAERARVKGLHALVTQRAMVCVASAFQQW